MGVDNLSSKTPAENSNEESIKKDLAKESVLEGAGFAFDLSREERTGVPEVIFASGKSCDQLLTILESLVKHGEKDFLLTRVSPEQYKALNTAPTLNKTLTWHYHQTAKVLHTQDFRERRLKKMPPCKLQTAIITAGSSDAPVAAEVEVILDCLGGISTRFNDIGVAGLHRLFRKLKDIRQADVLIVIAGMDGALPSVLAGLVDAPIIAVPSSVGYGAAFGGIAPLLTMLNTCAPGVAVVNIDNGFAAAVLAVKMARRHQQPSATTQTTS